MQLYNEIKNKAKMIKIITFQQIQLQAEDPDCY